MNEIQTNATGGRAHGSFFFGSADQGIHDVYTGFVRMLGHVLERAGAVKKMNAWIYVLVWQPTVIMQVSFPIRRELVSTFFFT